MDLRAEILFYFHESYDQLALPTCLPELQIPIIQTSRLLQEECRNLDAFNKRNCCNVLDVKTLYTISTSDSKPYHKLESTLLPLLIGNKTKDQL